METLAAIILVIILGGFPAMVMATMHRRVTYIMKELETHWDHFNYGDKTNSRDLDKFKTEAREYLFELRQEVNAVEVELVTLKSLVEKDGHHVDIQIGSIERANESLEDTVERLMDILGYKKRRNPPSLFSVVKKKEE